MSYADAQTDDSDPMRTDTPQEEIEEALVKTEQIGVVWVVTINRPAVRNAVNRSTAQALTAAFRHFEDDPALFVAVLTGAGGTFCAGADLTSGSAEETLHTAEDGDAPLGLARLQLSKPCVAAVEGYAVGGGFELALWCDLRVAASDAVFGVYHHRWGIPSMDGATVLLPRLIGQSRALDLLLTGRGVSGEEALTLGLVNRLVTPGSARGAAVTLAEEIARFPQPALRSDRLSSYEQWSLTRSEALLNETRHGLEVLQTEDVRAATKKFTSGRQGDA